MKKYYFLFAFGIIGICAFQYKDTAILPANIIVNGKLFTSLFQQRSAEYKALCFQAYTVARYQLDKSVTQEPDKSMKKAVISDIDETILDNSAFAVHQALKGKGYESAAWHEWTNRAEADTLAGALAFFKYAASKGVEVYYVSNRDEKDREGTLSNLKKFGFPDVDNDHLILKESNSSKESRRQKIAQLHNIILLLGDNLADFSSLFDNTKTTEERATATQRSAGDFGKKFIVLPNANYGDWENVLYSNTLTAAQKDSVIKFSLKSY